MKALMEVEASLNEVKNGSAANATVSFRQLKNATATLQARVAFLAFMLRKPPTFATNAVKPSDGVVDNVIIKALQKVWDDLPDLVQGIRGPEISIADPKFETKVSEVFEQSLIKFKK
jgi:hypothetical protein